MTGDAYSRWAIRLATSPAVSWDRAYQRKYRDGRAGNLLSAARSCESLAVWYVRAAAYIEARSNGEDHAGAVKAQNRRARMVRKALGYTYPDAPLTF